MKNKRIIRSFIAICSSVMIGTATLTASAAGAYDIEKDAWKFLNTSHSFGQNYKFTDSDVAPFKNNLTNVDRRLASNLISGQFLGSCYGMAVTSILASYGLIDYNAYTEGADCLYTMSGVENADDKPSDEIISLINYYSSLQFTEEVRQYVAYSMLEKTEKERLQQIIDAVEAGKPALVGYFGKINDSGDRYGHAVVAYNVEYGPFEVNYTEEVEQLALLKTAEFDGRIAVYNCNLDSQESSYIYFNNDGSWRTDKCSSDNDGNINFVISDIDLLNNKGLLGGTEKYNNERDFLAMLNIRSLLPERTVDKIKFDNGKWDTISSNEDEIIELPPFLGDVPQIYANTYVLKDDTSGYMLSTDGLCTMNLEMNYQNCVLIADVNAANQIVFEPSGYIEMNGDTEYGFEIAMNDEYYNGSWYSFRIDQDHKTKHSALMRTDKGYILKSDNLNNTIITTCDGENVFRREIDTEFDIDSVLIFEKTDGNIGFAADLDNNGSYETEFHKTPNGDVSGDGYLSINDVVLLQKWLLTVPNTILEDWEAADFTNDNRLDVFDLCLMKRALLSAKNEAPPTFNVADAAQTCNMLNIYHDESYDNITATALQPTYTTNTDEIICEVKNHNKGKGFFFFPIAFIEKYDNEGWEEIYNADPAIRYQYGDGYVLCGIANHEHDDMEFSTWIRVQTNNIFPSLKEGHYRFKIYTAKNILYAEFDVVAAEQ